jgi:hypothetical protein
MRAMGAVVFLVLGAQRASAQEYTGPKQCVGCHNANAKTSWLEFHDKSLAQVDAPAAARYAAATGGNAKDPRCLKCHAPTPLALGLASVSCETCHGPGKAYKAPHQEPAFYNQPDRKGLKDLYKNAAAVASLCVTCHVLGAEDKAIAAAGHPVGADFDAGKKLVKMAHWPSNDTDPPVSGGARARAYDASFYGQVAAAGAPAVKSRSAAAGGGKPSAAAAAPAPAPATGPAAAPAKGGRPSAPSPARAAAPAAGGDDEYLPLGEEEFRTPSKPAAEARAAASAFLPPPRPRPLARSPLPDPPSGAFEPPPAPAAPASVAPPAKAARAPGDPHLEAARMLARLLREKKTFELPPPAPPAEFRGPDGELLCIEDEILALALEALRSPKK